MATSTTFTASNQIQPKDRLESFGIYQLACRLFSEFWNDSEILMKDLRGRELAKQLTRSLDSICANIEEGYGRGFGKELPQHLKISRGEAREGRGRYLRCQPLLSSELVQQRIATLDHILGGLTNTINTIEAKQKHMANKPALVTRHPSPVTRHTP
jgi:four helix bundle protein